MGPDLLPRVLFALLLWVCSVLLVGFAAVPLVGVGPAAILVLVLSPPVATVAWSLSATKTKAQR